MTDLGTLNLEITDNGTGKKTEETLNSINIAAIGLLDAFEGVKGALDAIGISLGLREIYEFLKDSVNAANDAERAMMSLEVAVKNTGASWADVAPILTKNLEALQDITTFTQDDLAGALSRLTVIVGDVGSAMNAMDVVADLAAYKHISLAEAADNVGRAMNGNLFMLQRWGFYLNSSKDIVEQLREKMGNFAERDAQTFGGRFEQLKATFEDLQETIGKLIEDGLDNLFGSTETLRGKIEELNAWIKLNGQIIKEWGTSALAVFRAFADSFTAVGSGLFRMLDSLGTGFRFLGKVFRDIFTSSSVPEAMKRLSDDFTEEWGRIKDNFTIMNDSLDTAVDSIRLAGDTIRNAWLDTGDRSIPGVVTKGAKTVMTAHQNVRASVVELVEQTKELITSYQSGGVSAEYFAFRAKELVDQLVALRSSGAVVGQQLLQVNQSIQQLNDARIQQIADAFHRLQVAWDAGLVSTKDFNKQIVDLSQKLLDMSKSAGMGEKELQALMDLIATMSKSVNQVAEQATTDLQNFISSAISSFADLTSAILSGAGADQSLATFAGNVLDTLANLAIGLATFALLYGTFKNLLTVIPFGVAAAMIAGAIVLKAAASAIRSGVSSIPPPSAASGGAAGGGVGGGGAGSYVSGGSGDPGISQRYVTNPGVSTGGAATADASIGPNYFIGVNDPTAQRQLVVLLRNAKRRGLDI